MSKYRMAVLVGIAAVLSVTGAAVVFGAFPTEGGVDPSSPLNAPVGVVSSVGLEVIDVPVPEEVLSLAPTWLPAGVEMCQVDVGLSDVTRRYCLGSEPLFAMSAVGPSDAKVVLVEPADGTTIQLSGGRWATLVRESVTSRDESGAATTLERIGLAVYDKTSDLPVATLRSLGGKVRISEEDLKTVAESVSVGPPMRGVPINLEALLDDPDLARVAAAAAGGEVTMPASRFSGVRGTFIFFGNRTWLAESGSIEFLAE